MTEVERVEGVGRAFAKKLRNVYVTTAEILSIETPTGLAGKTDINEQICRKLIEGAQELSGSGTIKTGTQVEDEIRRAKRLSTGVETLDGKLVGGLDQGSLVELYGLSRSGKTQFCHQLATLATLPPSEGGLGTGTVWVSTNRSFRPLVIRMMARRFGTDPDKVISGISVIEVDTGEQMVSAMQRVFDLCQQGKELVIIDTLALPYWGAYLAVANIRKRLGELSELVDRIGRFARKTGTVFVYTNQVSRMKGYYGRDPPYPMSDDVMSHACDYRFYLSRTSHNTRRLKLLKGPSLPEIVSKLELGWGGFYQDMRARKQMECELGTYLDVEKKVYHEKLEETRILEVMKG